MCLQPSSHFRPPEGGAQWPPGPQIELTPPPPARMSPPLPSGPDTIEWLLPTASFIPEGIHTRDVTVAPFSDGQ